MIQAPLILNIPHSSTNVPSREGYLASDTRLENELLLLTDWYTDELFQGGTNISVRAAFSRVFCDVERFASDEMEDMSKKGMGVLYTHCDDGSPLRSVSPVLRSGIIESYYTPHHKRLTQAIADQLRDQGRAFIIDCHSFPDTPLIRDLDQNPGRPDINIGTDIFHTPAVLVEISQRFCNKYGLSLGIDTPYSGTIVPLEFYHKDPAVMSMMIEVNRKLYLEEGTNIKSLRYLSVKQILTDLLFELRCVII